MEGIGGSGRLFIVHLSPQLHAPWPPIKGYPKVLPQWLQGSVVLLRKAAAIYESLNYLPVLIQQKMRLEIQTSISAWKFTIINSCRASAWAPSSADDQNQLSLLRPDFLQLESVTADIRSHSSPHLHLIFSVLCNFFKTMKCSFTGSSPLFLVSFVVISTWIQILQFSLQHFINFDNWLKDSWYKL